MEGWWWWVVGGLDPGIFLGLTMQAVSCVPSSPVPLPATRLLTLFFGPPYLLFWGGGGGKIFGEPPFSCQPHAHAQSCLQQHVTPC